MCRTPADRCIWPNLSLHFTVYLVEVCVGWDWLLWIRMFVQVINRSAIRPEVKKNQSDPIGRKYIRSDPKKPWRFVIRSEHMLYVKLCVKCITGLTHLFWMKAIRRIFWNICCLLSATYTLWSLLCVKSLKSKSL